MPFFLCFPRLFVLLKAERTIIRLMKKILLTTVVMALSIGSAVAAAEAAKGLKPFVKK